MILAQRPFDRMNRQDIFLMGFITSQILQHYEKLSYSHQNAQHITICFWLICIEKIAHKGKKQAVYDLYNIIHLGFSGSYILTIRILANIHNITHATP